VIPMNDFAAEPEELRRREMAAVERVLRSGWYVLGGEVRAFEAAWAGRCGTQAAVGVGNGMDAIEIGLRAAGIGAGDEVITTPMTAFASVLAIIRAGATPVLADIDAGTALLGMESVARCISRKTKAVLLVHLYGQIGDMDRWVAFCSANGLLLIEDCAQSHLASWNSRVAGGFGVLGAYSFYPTKNLGAAGDAGALVTNDPDIAERARRLRSYGQSDRYHHPDLGLNSRLDELHAAILSERLAWLDEFTARRRAIARRYWQVISNPAIRLLVRPEHPDSHVHHLFVVCCAERDRLGKTLAAAGIGSVSHYPVPVHLQPPCRSVRIDPAGLPVAERHGRECLSIPCHPQMSEGQVGDVVGALNEFA
jgi:dTDP-4-amino-4,6-dideoxygalactose transaminase